MKINSRVWLFVSLVILLSSAPCFDAAAQNLEKVHLGYSGTGINSHVPPAEPEA